MKTIALFIHQPKCSVQSANGIIRALGRDYRFKILNLKIRYDIAHRKVYIVYNNYNNRCINCVILY